MATTSRVWTALAAAALGALAVTTSPVNAQPAAPPTRMVDVDGRAMRVAVAGVEQRKPGQPVVVLEAGAAETGIEAWTAVFADLARVAPVVAYDRRGVGKSEADTVKVTLRRTAQSLRALLRRLDLAPPYVLVGHSWGGIVTRAYFDQFPSEVAGFVFLDAMNVGVTREEQAKAAPPEERARILEKPTMPPIPPDTPPGLRAEYELIASEMVDDFPEARLLRSPEGVPIAVVKAAPPGRLASLGDGISLASHELAAIALRSPKGLYIAAGHVGHNVQRDDPQLVVHVVQHVLKHSTAAASAK